MNEPWRKVSDKELTRISELERQRVINYTEEIIETNGMSRSELSEWKTNVEVNAEFAAMYYKDNAPIGLIQFIVIQPGKNADLSADKYAEMIKQELLFVTDAAQISTSTLCGKEYKMVEATEAQTTGKPVLNRYYIRKKANTICMVVTRVYGGSEHIFDEIYRGLREYKK